MSRARAFPAWNGVARLAGTGNAVALPALFAPFGRMSTNTNDRPPAAWRVTYGPWRPLDERRFQEAIERATGRTADSVFRAWAQGASSIGPLGQGLVEAMKLAGMGQDAGIRIERELFNNRVPNPATSRPAEGQPNAPDDLPGWANLLPYYFAPEVLPAYQMSQAASLAALATRPTGAQVDRLAAEVRRVYGSSDYANQVVAQLEAMKPSRTQVTITPTLAAKLQDRAAGKETTMSTTTSSPSRVVVGIGLALAVAAIVAAASR